MAWRFHFPISKYDFKPWFTKGLRNACRKKNCLYKKFLQNRTNTAEMKINTKRTKINLHLYSETVKKMIILNYSNKKKKREGDMKDIEYNYQKRQEKFKLPR